jgi:hypothetical protein
VGGDWTRGQDAAYGLGLIYSRYELIYILQVPNFLSKKKTSSQLLKGAYLPQWLYYLLGTHKPQFEA